MVLFHDGEKMSDDNKITIIEGPPPIFEQVQDGWALGIGESPRTHLTVMTRLRTFNGPALVERCYRAWHSGGPIHLHYRNDMGLEQTAPIIAARTVDSKDGQVLFLWLNLENEKVEYEFDASEDDDLDDNPDNLN
jgi:predicted urease superfamily metal-dependent hydrolase